jgi:2-polyprenyl-3-methyl-5-hydroxy-6-metoxy-1,4-benzoquinol methylase
VSTADLERYRSPFVAGRARQIEAILPGGRNRNALELGCGPGYFTRMLRDRHWKPTSVDVEPRHLEHATEAAETTLLGDAIAVIESLREGAFGLVLALEIIEHMPREAGEQLLAHAFRVLEPGGLLVLSTPNRWSLEGLNGYYIEELLRRRERWQAWDPTHQYIYSSREMLALVRRSGFSIDAVRGYWYATELPRIGRVRLPFEASAHFPLNRLGFSLSVRARKTAP